jgi:hypothetical protein
MRTLLDHDESRQSPVCLNVYAWQLQEQTCLSVYDHLGREACCWHHMVRQRGGERGAVNGTLVGMAGITEALC